MEREGVAATCVVDTFPWGRRRFEPDCPKRAYMAHAIVVVDRKKAGLRTHAHGRHFGVAVKTG